MKRLIFILTVTLLICACQPTPEQEIVANKGDGSFEQKLAEAQHRSAGEAAASATPASSVSGNAEHTKAYPHPDSWTEKVEYESFSLSIDAKIEVGGSSYPVTRVAASDFQDQSAMTERILSALMPDADGQRQGTLCHEDYAEEAESYAYGRFDPEKMIYVPYTAEEQEELRPRLEKLADLMRTAPKADEYERFNGFSVTPGTSMSYHTSDGKS